MSIIRDYFYPRPVKLEPFFDLEAQEKRKEPEPARIQWDYKRAAQIGAAVILGASFAYLGFRALSNLVVVPEFRPPNPNPQPNSGHPGAPPPFSKPVFSIPKFPPPPL